MENIPNLFPVIFGAIAALLSVHWIYFKILKIAFSKKLVDNPNARKLQKRSVPVVGGLAVFFGLIVGIMVAAAFHKALFPESQSINLLPVVLSMSIMLYVGAMDDIMGLTPKSRFFVEIASIICLVFSSGMCVDTFRGMFSVNEFCWWIAVPLTVFAGVGIINAINMIDGVNGLSSGLCITYCILYGIVFIHAKDIPNTVLAFTMAAAMIPFYIHNVFGWKSRMFIGDAGTMVIGMMMSWFVICLLSRNNLNSNYTTSEGMNLIAFALAVMAVPIFDTLRVMTMRIVKRQSPFSPDKTHLHHAFVNIGISHFITSTTEILISLIITGTWWMSVLLGMSLNMQLVIVVLSAMVFVWGTYALLRYHIKRHTEFLHLLSGFSVRTHLGRTEWWKNITKLLDAPVDYPIGDMTKEELDDHIQKINKTNYKETDRKLILEYMKGKAEVHVDDIIANSGAEKLRVFTILFEEEQEGYVVTIKSSSFGAPEIVALKSEI